MNVMVCFRAVFDDAGIRIESDGSLDCSHAARVVGIYDLNAIEAAARFCESTGSHLSALTVGEMGIDDSTMCKNVCARGPQELHVVMDDRLADAETLQAASVIAGMVGKVGDIDIVICGDGSADRYTHQVGVQVGEMLGIPSINAVRAFSFDGETVSVERELENEIEMLEVEPPCVLSVLPTIAAPRTCSVMDIMTAGQKPVRRWNLDDAGIEYPVRSYGILRTFAPESAPRRNVIFDGAADEGLTSFFEAFGAYLRTEGAN